MLSDGWEECVSEIMRKRVFMCVAGVADVGEENMIVVVLELWSLGGSVTVQVGLAWGHPNRSFL